MTDHEKAEWVQLATFGTVLEAEMARQRLDDAGIPALTKSDAAGIFGLGFQGAVTGGVTVHVPGPELDRAIDLLEDEGDP